MITQNFYFQASASYVKYHHDEEDELINIEIKNIIKHPDYVSKRKFNDIALIELERDVVFTYYRNPACLHYDTILVKSSLTITGWRRESSNNDTLSGWMLQARVEESNFDVCNSKLSPLTPLPKPKVLLRTSQLCAMGKIRNDSIDTCRRSDIGPLQFQAGASFRYIHYIYGIYSFEIACNNEISEGVS